ncbi:hypothetical protein [Archaeoglobus veneficus]|uniref:Uncharacterized protein n=1 Tax=Archaeoglobus veneficus (strain DSM 11195 / SNP6) TaxID=693661 RepID=F2KNS8_ARCVS|nr:hypothetical protein [Archaeoglobus veneficus]AEA47405.1 hypothetical protein Arcve_1401 [Archaeoglobus veneficus SNP6]
MFRRGLRLLARNPVILLFPLASIIVFYLFMVAAVFTAIPAEELKKVAESGDVERMSEKIRDLMTADLTKTLLVFLLFGTVAFVAVEFFNAALIGSARELAVRGSFTIPSAIDYGLLHTMRLIAVDTLCSLALLAVAMPFSALSYVTQNENVYTVLLLVLVLSMPFVVMPRYVLIADNCGVFEAIARGFSFAIRNYFKVFAAMFMSAIVALLSIIPFLAPLFEPLAVSLLSVWLMLLYLGKQDDISAGTFAPLTAE